MVAMTRSVSHLLSVSLTQLALCGRGDVKVMRSILIDVPAMAKGIGHLDMMSLQNLPVRRPAIGVINEVPATLGIGITAALSVSFC